MKIKNNIKWTSPVHSKTTVHGLHSASENNYQKPFVMFDEMFPKKKIDNHDQKYDYKETNDTFHRAMWPVLAIGQCFGILPVFGISKPDATYLRFTWISWKVILTLLYMTGAAIFTLAGFFRTVKTGVDIYKTVSLVFYGSTFLSLLLFLRLASKWPSLLEEIGQREKFRLNTSQKRSLRCSFKIYCVAILVPALIEHLLSIISGLAIAFDCNSKNSVAEAYFVSSFEMVFFFTSYSLWKGVILQIINLESTFNWSFTDLFIIVVSLGLSDRFTQLNERLNSIKGKHLPESFWKTAREEFAHLSVLVKIVDKSINEIVLLSFTNNLYFICIQLFNSLNNVHEVNMHGSDCGGTLGILRGLSHAIYFSFSFGFLMVRFIAVSLGAAKIHSVSRQPAEIIYSAPTSSYGVEMQRFLEHVVTDTIGLTGLNFFYVTRGLILTIAGTIVTYELVLVQFNTTPTVMANITTDHTCRINKA